MQRGGICPVCETPHEVSSGESAGRGSAPVEPAAGTSAAPSALARWWKSGRLGVVISLLCFAVATVLPLAYVRPLAGGAPSVALSPLALIEGVPLEMGGHRLAEPFKSMTSVAVPGAALAMASFLWSRRTRGIMQASRPLVFVVALMPSAAAVLPLLKLGRLFWLTYSIGPAVALVALGVIAGVAGAVQFGNGMPEEPSRRRRLGHDEDDEE